MQDKQIRHDLESERGIAIGVAEGHLTLPDIQEAAVGLWNKVAGPKVRILWDLRNAHFDLTETQIRQLAEFVKQTSPAGPQQAAFVVKEGVAYGLVRMYEAHRQAPNARTMVFTDMQPALDWLKEEDVD